MSVKDLLKVTTMLALMNLRVTIACKSTSHCAKACNAWMKAKVASCRIRKELGEHVIFKSKHDS